MYVLLALVSVVAVGSYKSYFAHADTAVSTPVFSSVAVNPTQTGAVITWTSNIAGTSQVSYGTTSSYTATSTLDSGMVLNHTVNLTGLTPNTMYHFELMSMSASSTASSSVDMTFTTSTTSTATTTGTGGTGTTTNATTSVPTMVTYHVMVMKHLCNSNIHNLTDFQNLETGKAPVAALANTVLNCPTTGLVGDAAAVGAVSSPRMTYNFQVKNGTTTQTLQNGTFMSHKLCESDINLDVNNDGSISTSTCLDISHYDIAVHTMASSSMISVTENQPPQGFHFGTIRFTPNALSANNDSQSLVSTDVNTGVINLNVAQDTDGVVMLHIYNFQNATTSTTTGTGGTSSTTPPDNKTLQDEINDLQNQVNMLKTQIAGLLAGHGGSAGGNGGDTTPPPSSGIGMIDQNNQTVKAGGSIDFGGHNFGREEHVKIMMGGAVVGDAFTNSSGSFSTGSMTLPSTPGTTATYTFSGQTSGITSTATLTIQ